MTTTLSAHGGGAQPARIDSSGKVTGGAAMRVYGFASEAEALAAGFVCEGGPAMSVAIITDAQIASGAWKLDGDPFAVVIYTAPDNIPSEGGFAVPVYPVNGWGSAPAPIPDPIGDGLRADCVAYWTMDEAEHATRKDATLRGNDLADPELFGAVGSVTGKIGNAADFPFQNSFFLKCNSTADLTLGDVTHTWFGWIKFTDTADGANIFGKGSDLETIAEYLVNFNTTVAYGLHSGAFVQMADSLFAPTIGEWFFLECGFNHDLQTVFIRINNGTEQTAIYSNAPTSGSGEFEVGNTPPENLGGEHSVDELGLIKRLLTTNERDYLYNSGAGRTLYP